MTTAPTTQRPRTTPPPTPPRRRAWAFAAAFIVVLILGGAFAFLGGGDESLPADEVATTPVSVAPTTAPTTTAAPGVDITTAAAIEIADAFMAARNARVPAGADLYTEDGQHYDSPSVGVSGRDMIAVDIEDGSAPITNAQRVGDVTLVDSTTFTFPAQYDWEGATCAGVMRFEVEGTLIARSEWLYKYEAPIDEVDAYFDAWNADDPSAVGALYSAANGVHIDPEVGILRGRDQIEADVDERSATMTDARRTGDLTLSGKFTFTFPARFERDGATWAGVMEIDTRSGFIFRTEWLGWSRID